MLFFTTHLVSLDQGKAAPPNAAIDSNNISTAPSNSDIVSSSYQKTAQGTIAEIILAHTSSDNKDAFMVESPSDNDNKTNTGKKRCSLGINRHIDIDSESEDDDYCYKEEKSDLEAEDVFYGISEGSNSSDESEAVNSITESQQNTKDDGQDEECETGKEVMVCDGTEHDHEESGRDNTETGHENLEHPPLCFSLRDGSSGQYRQWLLDWLSSFHKRNKAIVKKYGNPDETDWNKEPPIAKCCNRCNLLAEGKQLPDETWLLENLLNDMCFKPGWNIWSRGERATVLLLDKLNQIKGCPVTLYDDIRDWAREYLIEKLREEKYCRNVLDSMRSSKSALKHFEKRSNMGFMRPITTNYHVQEASGSVPVTRIPFLSSLYYQLTNFSINCPSKRIVDDPRDPYKRPQEIPSVYKDIKTGRRCIEVYGRMKKNKMDKTVGVMTLADASYMDDAGQNSADMVCYTLSLSLQSRNLV